MKVIWATDGFGNADAALPFARELACTGGSLIAVHCNEILYGKAPGRGASGRRGRRTVHA